MSSRCRKRVLNSFTGSQWRSRNCCRAKSPHWSYRLFILPKSSQYYCSSLCLKPVSSVSYTCPQVMGTALKKKLEQVKELFDRCTEVFQELLSVRAHLLQRIDTCQTAVQKIHFSVRMLSADNKDILQQHLQVFPQIMKTISS